MLQTQLNNLWESQSSQSMYTTSLSCCTTTSRSPCTPCVHTRETLPCLWILYVSQYQIKIEFCNNNYPIHFQTAHTYAHDCSIKIDWNLNSDTFQYQRVSIERETHSKVGGKCIKKSPVWFPMEKFKLNCIICITTTQKKTTLIEKWISYLTRSLCSRCLTFAWIKSRARAVSCDTWNASSSNPRVVDMRNIKIRFFSSFYSLAPQFKVHRLSCAYTWW